MCCRPGRSTGLPGPGCDRTSASNPMSHGLRCVTPRLISELPKRIVVPGAPATPASACDCEAGPVVTSGGTAFPLPHQSSHSPRASTRSASRLPPRPLPAASSTALWAALARTSASGSGSGFAGSSTAGDRRRRRRHSPRRLRRFPSATITSMPWERGHVSASWEPGRPVAPVR